jgi:hypothetical protein
VPPGDDLPNENTLRLAIEQRRLERRELSRLGRPEFYEQRRVLGFVSMGAGAASSACGLALAWWIFGQEETPPASREQVAGYTVAIVGGAAVMGVGIWAVLSAARANPYWPRMEQLAQEEEELARDIKRVRRERKRRARYTLAPGLSAQPGLALLRMRLVF